MFRFFPCGKSPVIFLSAKASSLFFFIGSKKRRILQGRASKRNWTIFLFLVFPAEIDGFPRESQIMFIRDFWCLISCTENSRPCSYNKKFSLRTNRKSIYLSSKRILFSFYSKWHWKFKLQFYILPGWEETLDLFPLIGYRFQY